LCSKRKLTAILSCVKLRYWRKPKILNRAKPIGRKPLKDDAQGITNQTERRRDYGSGRMCRGSHDAVVIIRRGAGRRVVLSIGGSPGALE
jgi:hypothetical protein